MLVKLILITVAVMSISSTIYSQSTYHYDEYGRTIADWSEGIIAIKWSNRNQVVSITRADTCHSPDLLFTYDNKGRRFSKLTKPRNGKGLTDRSEWTCTYYQYNYKDQLVATYSKEVDQASNEQLSLVENHISFTGYEEVNIPVGYLTSGIPTNSKSDESIRGRKKYELKNYRGDVALAINDRPITGTEERKAALVSASDYYAFGMIMPERNLSTDEYRYGYGGMEKDDEWKGRGNSYDFGARMYDPRMGRWSSVDAMATKYASHSPYNYAINNPIMFGDEDGNDVTILPLHGLFQSGDGSNYQNLIQRSIDLLYNTKESSRILNEAQNNHHINVIVTFTDDPGAGAYTAVPTYSVRDIHPLQLAPAVTASNGFFSLNDGVAEFNHQLYLYDLGPASMGQDLYFVIIPINHKFDEHGTPVTFDPALIATLFSHEVESHVNIPLRNPQLYSQIKNSGLSDAEIGTSLLDHLLIGHHERDGQKHYPVIARDGDNVTLFTTGIEPGSIEEKFVEELFIAGEFQKEEIGTGTAWVAEYLKFIEKRKNEESKKTKKQNVQPKAEQKQTVQK